MRLFFWKDWIKKKPAEDPVMFIIAGLGNPGDRYKGTRHNVGFECIDKLSYDHNIPVTKNKHRGLIGTGSIAGKPVALVKPQTYMNRSGECIKAALDFYKLGPENLIVIFDDASLALGSIRVRQQGSAGGQKGMKNIISQLGTDAFTRVRIGIDPKPDGWDLSDYVLNRFHKKEHEAMIEGITRAGDAAAKILADGPAAAMNRFNGKGSEA
jgi:PTH1 family peptidyl-tRNA hydrolase